MRNSPRLAVAHARRPAGRLPLAAALLVAGSLAGQLVAGQVRHFVLDTPRTLAGATSHGVAVRTDGSLTALSPLTEVAQFSEPLGLAMAVAPDGAVWVGTGHPARIYRVAAGTARLVGEVNADQITSLAFGREGEMFAATAAPARLIRVTLQTGAIQEVAKLEEGNLWDLVWFQGSLVAAAGNPGRLLRLTAKGLEVLATIPDRHARCLAVSGDQLLIGTSGKGLVLRWRESGLLGAVYDSGFTEIAALAVSPDGLIWAAGLTGDPSLGKAPPAKDDPEPTITVSETTSATPPVDKGPGTSEIVSITPTGAATVVHRFTKQLAAALVWGDQGLVIGTGLEGEIWQLVDGSAAQLDSVSASQVVRLAAGGSWVLTQGPVRLLQRSGAAHGTFTSPPLDAGQPASWGETSMRGELPVGGCTIRFRAGTTTQPDDTWSAWSQAQPCGSAKVAAPPARYLQWQVELQGQPPTRVGRVDVAYRQLNLPPVVKELTVHDPGEVFLKGPPPADRIIEVQHPDLSGIFTTLDEDSDRQERLGKKYYRIGYQTVSWKVEDPNGDSLRFAVELQREGSDRWWPVRRELEATLLSLDTHALADGMYRFRLTASDDPANADSPATARSLSSWFVVDNTPPVVSLRRDGSRWLVVVNDALSPLIRVEWTRDADAWHALVPEDGILEGRSERFTIPVAQGQHVLAVQAVDDHHNVATAAVEEGR